MTEATEALKGGGGGSTGKPSPPSQRETDHYIEIVPGSSHRARVGTHSDSRHKATVRKPRLSPKMSARAVSPKASPKVNQSPNVKRKIELGSLDISAPHPLPVGLDRQGSSVTVTVDDDDDNAGPAEATATAAGAAASDVAAVSDGEGSGAHEDAGLGVVQTGDVPRRATLSQRMGPGSRSGGVFEPRREVSDVVDAMGGGQLQSMLASTPASPSSRSTTEGEAPAAGGSVTPTDASPLHGHGLQAQHPDGFRTRRSTFSKLLGKKSRKSNEKEKGSPRKSDGKAEETVPGPSAPPAPQAAPTSDTPEEIDWNSVVRSEIAQLEHPSPSKAGQPTDSAWAGYLDVCPVDPDAAGPTDEARDVAADAVVGDCDTATAASRSNTDGDTPASPASPPKSSAWAVLDAV